MPRFNFYLDTTVPGGGINWPLLKNELKTQFTTRYVDVNECNSKVRVYLSGEQQGSDQSDFNSVVSSHTNLTYQGIPVANGYDVDEITTNLVLNETADYTTNPKWLRQERQFRYMKQVLIASCQNEKAIMQALIDNALVPQATIDDFNTRISQINTFLSKASDIQTIQQNGIDFKTTQGWST